MSHASVQQLSNKALVTALDQLSQQERLTTLNILLHIAEIERRKLWRTLEHSSMYDYCKRRLHYSEGATSRRVRTARVLAKHPEVAERIRRGRLSLCVISRVADQVLRHGRADLLDRLEGMTLDEVDSMVAELRRPGNPVRERVYEMRLRPPSETQGPPLNLQNGGCSPGESVAGERNLQNGGSNTRPPKRVFKIQFGLSEAQMKQLRRVQSLSSQKVKRTLDLPDVIGLLCEAYLDRQDPVRRTEKRASKKPQASAVAKPAGASRHIPQQVRDTIHVRDGGRCTFVDASGRRCGETRFLHIDHVHPFALGGNNDPTNLRLLCSAHNQLMAERVFGDQLKQRAAGP